ncbi:MAG: hypothetical protein LIO90_10685 [Bacteroidales bacterium]|nr:hypothetical protein [Bacteroidales bacterium]
MLHYTIADVQLTYYPDGVVEDCNYLMAVCDQAFEINPDCKSDIYVCDYSTYETLVDIDPNSGAIEDLTAYDMGCNWYYSWDEVITEPGSYYYYIPAGYFLVNGEANAEYYGYFTIKEAVKETLDLTTNPADGASVATLSTVVLSYDGMDVSYNENNDVTAKIMSGLDTVAEGTPELVTTGEYTTVKITFPEVSTPGDYVVFIPEGYCIIGEQYTTYANTMVWNTITVTGAVEADLQGLTLDPAPGEVAILNGQIAVSAEEGTLTYDNSVGNPTLSVGGEEVDVCESVGVMGDVIYLYFEERWSAPGTYTLNIPAGYFLVDGTALGAITCDYIITEKNYSIEANPAAGLTYAADDLEAVEITVNCSTEVGFFNGFSHNYITITKTTADVTAEIVAKIEDSSLLNAEGIVEDANGLIKGCSINLGQYATEIGTYNVIIPAGFFFTEGWECEETTLTYYITTATGISSILGDSKSSYRVVNMQGMEVLRSANADALKSLAPGFYIINGKKVLVR